ncbi:Multidomain signal transduction protein, predicted phosphodiesterase (contains HD-GYP domain) [Anoxybacillus flavithermus WK1]|uniref:Multidomain signal transduction protein, predicted phosphodiesterase (Contains HD-GYP domain) n=1 Tax=Anoxybacillus flavithermus (strain DSM 21510 / WK1) TaxID=491915 RepID=B7GKX6_ANOFW|nr:Multidomain signal transduction protein, predicted phosphodiesterase (contains HD-GYP domain) [Anoxybacillus flavithermus WK1]
MNIHAHARRTIFIWPICFYTVFSCTLIYMNISNFPYILVTWLITLFLFVTLSHQKMNELLSFRDKKNEHDVYQYIYKLKQLPVKIMYIFSFCSFVFLALLFFAQENKDNLLLLICLYGIFHSFLFYIIDRTFVNIIAHDVHYFYDLGYRIPIISSDSLYMPFRIRLIHYNVSIVSFILMYMLAIKHMLIKNSSNDHVFFFNLSTVFLCIFVIFFLIIVHIISKYVKETIYTLKTKVTQRDIPNIYIDEFSNLVHALNIYNDPINKALRLLAAIENKGDEHKYIADHSRRVAYYCLQIGQSIGLQDHQLNSLYQASLLHAIGKIGIPDYILLKKEALSADEFSFIKQYPIISYFLAKSVFEIEDKDALEAILFHKEYVDGTGYPNQLKDKEIPIMAKIISVADSFDALMSTRPYRQKKNKDEIIHILKKESGIKWDCDIVSRFIDLFLKNRPNIMN